MPVRIYDIAKKHGVESKAVLAKAWELGITQAKVASSTLDKITAEYLEQHLPGLAAPPPPPAPTVIVEPIKIVVAPPPEPEPAPPPSEPEPMEPEGEGPADFGIPVEDIVPPAADSGPVPEETVIPASAPETMVVAPPETAIPESPVEGIGTVPPAAVPPPPPVAPPPVAPAKPPLSQIGQKVGFVDLSKFRPSGRPAAPERPERGGRAQVRPAPPAGRTEPGQRPAMGRGAPPPTTVSRSPGAPKAAPAPRGPAAPVLPAGSLVISMKPPISVRELAEQLKRKPFQIIADLMEVGVFANVNQNIEEPVAARICAKYGFKFEIERRAKRESGHGPEKKKKDEYIHKDDPKDLKSRAPVVTIMGHVDHGKTTLLDAIRQTNVAAGESGGITQHIGAYTITVPHPDDKKKLQQITFLDTPGHAAFSAMRARGANVTDIVILVVAANDGVMPQTLEALSHAQAAGVKVIVAVNKMDHPAAAPQKVRQQLQDRGLTPDDWGGETIYVDVSALTKMGVDKLLSLLVLQAEMMDLKANPDCNASGNVIESGLEPGGPTATMLVRRGTLHVGDIVICGQYFGKIRALINEDGKRMKEAGPSVAVKVLGLNGVPEAGIDFQVMDNDREVREEAAKRSETARLQGQETRAKVTLENLFATLDANSNKMLRVVVKADTQGSVEAICEALKKIESDKVALEIIHSAVGTITESDVLLASASHAIVLGFHSRIDNGVNDIAKREGVQIKLYAIIYELIDQVKEAMAGLLDPIVKDTVVGAAEVRKVFELSKGGNVAGCVVASGRIAKGKVRVMRRKSLVYEGVIQSLRRFQDEVNEVRAGMECGIRLEGFNEFAPGDMIESYVLEKIAQKL